MFLLSKTRWVTITRSHKLWVATLKRWGTTALPEKIFEQCNKIVSNINEIQSNLKSNDLVAAVCWVQ